MEEQERIREFQSMRSGYMIVTQVMTHRKSNYTSMLVRFTKGMYCFELTFWLYGSSFMRFNFNEKRIIHLQSNGILVLVKCYCDLQGLLNR